MKFLFISHDAYRTGAPILLLNLATLLKARGVQIDFLFKRGGELLDEFKKIGNTSIAQPSTNILARLKRRVSKGEDRYDLAQLPWNSYSLVLSNTITNGDILPAVRQHYTGKIISYIHELEMASEFFTNRERTEQLIKATDHYCVPCNAVKKFLETKYHIPNNSIDLLPYYISKKEFGGSGREKKKLFFLVGGVGTADWRKGPDIFIQVAATVFRSLPQADILFIWKGVSKNNTDVRRLQHDINKLGLADKILLEESSAQMPAFYQQLDLLLLTSREDPYPLVVLEAAAAGVPTVCFEEAGGAVEFVEASHGGRALPYLDIQAMAAEVIYLFQNRNTCETAGQNAKNYLEETHNNEDFVYQHLSGVINKMNVK